MKRLTLLLAAIMLLAAPTVANAETADEKHSKVIRVLLQQNKRIRELERKVAGMQKQITILHAKKADK